MSISSDFTPIHAFLGGAVLGLGTSWLLASNGRIAGFSGLTKGFLFPKSAVGWSFNGVFMAAFFSTAIVTNVLYPHIYAPGEYQLKPAALAASGVLVGMGTNIGSGCTSGHGICGLARFSKRSLFATAVFFMVALAVASIIRQLAFDTFYDVTLSLEKITDSYDYIQVFHGVVTVAIIIALVVVRIKHPSADSPSAIALLSTTFGAALMASGLALSGMTQPTKIFEFLDFLTVAQDNSVGWDPSLAFVLGGATGVALVAFRFILGNDVCFPISKMEAPLCEATFQLPTSVHLTKELASGMFLFGLGWGMGGICPGPALLGMASGRPNFYIWFVCFIAGTRLGMYLTATKTSPTVVEKLGLPVEGDAKSYESDVSASSSYL
jgi:uncharacterized membrane protein YedE/YeeE